jgi:anti-sigma regulatory factor (Ser/Thr protein kinase)
MGAAATQQHRTPCYRKGCAMQLSIPASPYRLAGVRRAVRAYLRGLPGEVADGVVLALNAVATNAMLYGSRGGQPVEVVVHVDDGCVEASVLDHGPQPLAGLMEHADTDELRTGGRGVWLLRRLLDEVRLGGWSGRCCGSGCFRRLQVRWVGAGSDSSRCAAGLCALTCLQRL